MPRKFNERKQLTFEYLAERQWVRPPAYAAALGIFPIRATYSYLRKLYKWNYLKRGFDIRGRVVYRLAPRGAAWLLRKHQRV